jgi:hypothetical protein
VLSPTQGPPARPIEPNRVRACNADIASACHRFIVGHPNRPRSIQEIPLAPKRPVLRFNTGHLYQEQADGSIVYRGEVLHTWVPRR